VRNHDFTSSEKPVIASRGTFIAEIAEHGADEKEKCERADEDGTAGREPGLGDLLRE